MTPKLVKIAGSNIEYFDCGGERPILYCHNFTGLLEDQPCLRALCKSNRVIAPSFPGFGRSELPDWIDSVDDLSYIALELLDELAIAQFDVVGCGLGGWIAAELAAKTPERVGRLVLLSPFGLKIGPHDRLAIPDIFAMPSHDLDAMLYAEGGRDRLSHLTDDELAIVMRNRETLTLLAWEPYFHNPKLRHRIQRINAPTLLLRGEKDGRKVPGKYI